LGDDFRNWVSSLPIIRTEVARGRVNGYRPIYLDAVAARDALWYRSVHARDQGRKWKPYYALTLRELAALVEYYQRKGWRPDVLTAYWNGEDFRFMMVVVDNADRVDWRLRLDMSREEYRKETAAEKQHGMMPLTVTSHGDEGDVRYAAIWVRYRVPE
jgi:hypothetical protein